MAGPVRRREAVVLRSIRYGEADRVLHLYTPHRGRVGAIAKGVRRAALALRRAPGAVLPPAARAPRGPRRPADGHRAPRRSPPTRACARTGPRSTPRRGPATPWRACSRPRSPIPRSSTCCATSSPCWTPSRRGPAAPTSWPSASSCCRRRASCPTWTAARPAGRPRTSPASPAPAGGVVCGACEARPSRSTPRPTTSSSARWARRWREAPDASARALRQAERAIGDTVEHHAHVRLRPAA